MRKSESSAFGASLLFFGLVFAAALLSGARTWSAEGAAVGTETRLSQLLATLEDEPLAAVGVEDAVKLPERFAGTNLGKMLNDPAYADGLKALTRLVTAGLGADFQALWPQLAPKLGGPAALVCLAPQPAEKNGAFRFVLLVLAPDAQNAADLTALWPRNAPPESLLASVTLKAVAIPELPGVDKLPAWARAENWPQGDLRLRVLPRKLGAALRPVLERHDKILCGGQDLVPFLNELAGLEIQSFAVGLACKGVMLREDFSVELAGADSALTRCARTLREKPAVTVKAAAAWDALLAATPGAQDISVLAQTDPKALQDDLPLAGQALERYLRGKRWTRAAGRTPEALAAERLGFLTSRLQGSFSLVAAPARTGELRLILAAGLKPEEPAPLRAELVAGLRTLDAEFATLDTASSIGGNAPLGAAFQGRGMFNAPVIGLSAGWAWLCSGSAAYQSLTEALKAGTTAAAEMKAAGPDGVWSARDALRAEVDLEDVLKIGYWAWVLGSTDGPSLGAWKVPAELLPPPQVFNGRVGRLRAALLREGDWLKGSATCAVPGTSVAFLWALQECADSLTAARQFAKGKPQGQP